MTPDERKIRFDVALDIANRVYTDYCQDLNVTREDAQEFCYFIIDMQRFSAFLEQEAQKAKCLEINDKNNLKVERSNIIRRGR